MLPAVASSSPATRRRQVVLPHPEGPTSTVNCRSGISSVTLFTASTLPNCLLICSSVTFAIIAPGRGPVSARDPRSASCRRQGSVYDAAPDGPCSPGPYFGPCPLLESPHSLSPGTGPTAGGRSGGRRLSGGDQ